MNLRTGIASITLALASLASVPAFASGFDAPTARPIATPIAAVAMPRGIIARPPVAVFQSNLFAARIRAQMNQIENAARIGVARHQLRPQVLGALRFERAQVENALNRALRNATINANEARRIESRLSEMSQVSVQYQTRFAHR